jgi:hypothetical protein
MCDYREQAIHAHAHGTAEAEQEKIARAHLAACAGCRSSYTTLLREMSGREFQRAASAAFLPPPMLAAQLHGHWIERLTSLLSAGRAPSGTATAERTAGVLGGGGLVKAAVATSAIVIAGAGVGARVVHSLEAPAPAHHHHKVAGHPAASTVSIEPTIVAGGLTSARTLITPHAATPARAKHHSTPPPSHGLGYLALGGGAGGGTAPQKPVAVTATTHPSGYVEESPPPSRSGGGTSLSYLGH